MIKSIVVCLMIGLVCDGGLGQTPATQPAFPTGVVSAAGITHTVLLHCPIEGKVFKIAPNGDVVGTYAIGAKGEDSWLLPDGHILGSHNGGVREIDPTSGAIVWEYKAGPG